MMKYCNSLGTKLLALLVCIVCVSSCDEDPIPGPKNEVFPVGTVTWASGLNQDQKNVISNLINNMVHVDDCTFYMGGQYKSRDSANYCSLYNAEDTAKWVGPVHLVNLPSFYIGKYEITQSEWMAVVGEEPSGKYCTDPSVQQDASWYDRFGKGDRVAAYNISFEDAQLFVDKLSELTGLSFALPTDAQWECAARGGRYSKGYNYSGSSTLKDVAWSGKRTTGVQEVGQLQANELGIYDMCGNVSEWVSNSYYKYRKSSDVTGLPVAGDTLILRGGSWVLDGKFVTNGYRKKFIQSTFKDETSKQSACVNCGLRIVLN